MRDSIFTLPADAPAGEAWALLWRMGFNIEHPEPGELAGNWMAGFDRRLLIKINHIGKEVNRHD